MNESLMKFIVLILSPLRSTLLPHPRIQDGGAWAQDIIATVPTFPEGFR